MEFDPTEQDFDKIRHYPADELTIDQMEILKSNADKLNDEEKGAFSYIIEDEEFEVEAKPNDDNENSDDDTEDKDDASKDDDGSGVPAFKTKAEIDAYVAEQTAKAIEEAKKKQADGTKDKEIPDDTKPKTPLDDPNWKPKNPQELADAIEARNNARAAENTAKANQLREETNKRLEREISELSSAGKIPKADTPEGKKAISQMATIAEKRNLSSFNDAYEEWSKTPIEFGGGYDPIKSAQAREADEKKTKLNKQKQLASRVSAGKGEPSSNKPKPIPYDKMKTMNTDEITDYALEQYRR